MRRPFTFLGSYAEESGGFPTLNGTLYDYWRSDLGVATSGGEVTIWTGQQNGYTFDQATSGGPTISGSNAGFNSIDTFTFNGSTSGLGHEGNAINGANTGDVQIAIYGAPHGDGGGWGAIFGVTTTGGSPFPSEAIMKATSTSVIEFYGYAPGGTVGSSDDTYGKGLYTITQGDPEGTGALLGAKFFNKSTNSSVTQAAQKSYSSYENTDQPFALGAYNPLNSAGLHGKLDLGGVVIWTNTTDLEADLEAIETYFQGIYG